MSTVSTTSSLAQGLNLHKTTSSNSGSGSLIGNGSNMAQNFAQAQSSSVRPAFNFQFNALQNAVIDRMNAKIEELNNVNSHKALDAALLTQRAAFVQLGTDIEPVREGTLANYYALGNLSDSLGSLNSAVEAASLGDTSAFDSALATINDVASKLRVVDGTPVGIVVADGTEKLKRDGVLMVTNADGTQTQATSYADFFQDGSDPADPAAVLTAITSALNKVFNVQDGNQLRAEVLATAMNNVQTGITQIDNQMTIQEQLDLASRAAEIAKIKQQYSYTLQALSLAFESSQSMADALTARLSTEMQVDRGSVMSLFT